MFKKCRKAKVLTVAAGAVGLATMPARADYNFAGDGLQVVSSGTVANGALYMPTAVSAWSTSSSVTTPAGYTTSFNTPACDDVVASRIVVAVYGGEASVTDTLGVSVNNGPATSVVVGGTNNAGATFSSGTNVYGSMVSGSWVVSIPVASSLSTNGSATSVNITETNSSSGLWNGNIVCVSLWEVYQQASLNNSFQYAVAEGSGDIYSTSPVEQGEGGGPTVPSRWVDMGGFNTGNLQSAQLETLYTYEHPSQDNALFMNITDSSNGTELAHPAVTYTSLYAAEQANFDVTSDLSATDNWLKFSVDPNDGVTADGINVLRPQVAILDATSAVPEPASLATLGLAGGFLTMRRKKHTLHPERKG